MIRPWIGYITIYDLEHEDVERVIASPLPPSLAELFGTPTEVSVPQNITAGAVAACGPGVPKIKPGSKVYYQANSAIVIGDLKVVHTNFVVAYEGEEAEEE